MKPKLSRRTFLKGLGFGAMTAAIVGMTGCDGTDSGGSSTGAGAGSLPNGGNIDKTEDTDKVYGLIQGNVDIENLISLRNGDFKLGMTRANMYAWQGSNGNTYNLGEVIPEYQGKSYVELSFIMVNYSDEVNFDAGMMASLYDVYYSNGMTAEAVYKTFQTSDNKNIFEAVSNGSKIECRAFAGTAPVEGKHQFDLSNATLSANRIADVRLCMLVPYGWQAIDLTCKLPLNPDKTVKFRLNLSDIIKA